MAWTAHTMAVGMSVMLLLAGCGGRPGDSPAQAEQHAGLAAVPASTVAPTSPATPVVHTATTSDEVAQLKEQVALLRREVADIRHQLAHLPGAMRSAEIPPDPRSDPAAQLEAERAEQLRIASSETAFRSEREDARWGHGAVASVRAAFADADESLRNQLRSIECRSQSCRVEISADTADPLARDLPAILTRLGQTLPNATAGRIDQGNGRQSTVIYLSR